MPTTCTAARGSFTSAARRALASRAPAILTLAVVLALCRTASASDPPTRSTSEYRFFLDPRARSEAAAISFTSAARLLLRGEDELLGLASRGRPTAPLAVLERLAALVLVDLPVASYELVVPHEIFGHGARYRELGAEASYHIGPPLPYDLKPDHSASPRSFRRPLYPDESMIVNLGGLQTQATQQRDLAFTVFRSGVLGRGDALLYAGNALTKIAQIFGARDLDRVASVIATRRRLDASRYRGALRFSAIGELSDPLLWYAIYAVGFRYLVRGDRELPFPAPRLGGARVWLTSRVLPVPWGVEPHLDALVSAGSFDADVALRPGFGPGGGSFGFQVDMRGVRVLRVLRLGLGVAGWLQPGLQIEAEVGPPVAGAPFLDFGFAPAVPGKPVPARVLGGAAHVDLEVHHEGWFLGTRLGVKSVGLMVDAPVGADVRALLSCGVKL